MQQRDLISSGPAAVYLPRGARPKTRQIRRTAPYSTYNERPTPPLHRLQSSTTLDL